MAATSAETKPAATAVRKNLSVNLRPISNGFIVRKSWEEETGEGENCCTHYRDEETYFPTDPLAGI